MKNFKILNKLGSMRTTSVVGSLLSPLVDNRLVPYPWLMTVVVTRRCNSRCQMCNIWQEKDSMFLSLDQYSKIFKNNKFPFVRSLTITGGEPTLRKDLPELFNLFLENLTNLEHIHLATSGLNTERTIKTVEAFIHSTNNLKNNISRLDVQISLDGVGLLHDEIRGIPGYFKKTDRTIKKLLNLKSKHPILNIKLSSVTIPQNIAGVQSIQEYAKTYNLTVTFSPIIISSNYYNNQNLINSLPFHSSMHKEKASEFYKGLSHNNSTDLHFYYADMAEMVNGNPRGRRCMMGYYGFVLEHDGNVYPCVNCESISFGNLLEKTFESIWFDNQPKLIRHNLRMHCCPTCSSMCYSDPINASELIYKGLNKIFRK